MVRVFVSFSKKGFKNYALVLRWGRSVAHHVMNVASGSEKGWSKRRQATQPDLAASDPITTAMKPNCDTGRGLAFQGCRLSIVFEDPLVKEVQACALKLLESLKEQSPISTLPTAYLYL